MNWMNGIPGAEWGQDLARMGGAFLQTSHWAAFNIELGRRVFHAAGDGWCCLAILEEARTGTRLYCPFGPLAQSRAALADALRALRALAHEQKAVFVRMEPMAPVGEGGLPALDLRRALKDVQPRLLWILDLDKPREQVLAGMTATNRNLYRNYAKKNLAVRVSVDPADMPILLPMIKEVSARNGIIPHPDHYYQKMGDVLMERGVGKLYIVEHDGVPVASSICFDSITTRYYAHAGSLSQARRVHPGSVLLASMVLDAVDEGRKAFDFIGVAPPDAPETDPWHGLTTFKQSFGGEYRPHRGTWELPVKNLRYRVYRAAYQAERRIR